MWYNYLSKGFITDKKLKFKKQWVFDLYKSENSASVEKTRNPFLKWIALIFIFLAFGLYNARTLFSKDARNKTEPVAQSQGKASPDSKTPHKQAVSSEIVDVRISYLTENGIVYVLFNEIFYKFKEFPYPIKNGPFKTLVASVPKDALPKSDESSSPSQSEKDRI